MFFKSYIGGTKFGNDLIQNGGIFNDGLATRRLGKEVCLHCIYVYVYCISFLSLLSLYVLYSCMNEI